MAGLTFTSATFGRKSAANVGAGDIAVSDVRELRKRLKAIEPRLATQLMRDVKAIGKPIQTDIKSAIQAVTPLSGMVRPGTRLNWNRSVDGKGKSHAATDVKNEFRTRSSGKSLTTTLARIRVASPAVVMADMAGRSGRFIGGGYKGSGVTRVYPYKGGTRSHRVDGNGVKDPSRNYKFGSQGRALLSNLGGKASRYAWPAAEKSLPAAKIAIEKVLRDAFTFINMKGL